VQSGERAKLPEAAAPCGLYLQRVWYDSQEDWSAMLGRCAAQTHAGLQASRSRGGAGEEEEDDDGDGPSAHRATSTEKTL
jgi:hypothetical protein